MMSASSPSFSLRIKDAAACRWDVLSLGEVMLRFDPGEQRITQARSFQVWEGGGEYNVARGLSRCFRQRASIVTALVDNPLGRLAENLILSGGVDVSHVLWREDDGVGKTSRNGIYFLERGFGIRNALGMMDRGHTAISQLQLEEIDWESIFGVEGVRWFHTGGIFCALAEQLPHVARAAMEAARRHGTIISYDCNYRPSLWKSRGGRGAAAAANRELLPYIDVLFGHEEDFLVDAASGATKPPHYDEASFAAMAERLKQDAPNLQVITMAVRSTPSANRNDWKAFAGAEGQLYSATAIPDLEVLDRVGSGDAFASGFVYGLLEGRDLEWSLECGLAHGALVMTTPGDNSFATLKEVMNLMAGAGAHVQR
ncbi:PfkB family carbohydrate kinase [Silvibacterium sp.]|uniref:PfkB family carbohydrate kinase n=1 Tax=Silvibacterium sp. TaxID=1964179 RepID=UPI0039E29DDA